MSNYYSKMNWAFMLEQYPRKALFNINQYYKILSPDKPSFLDEYASVPSMQRLKGVGLLCGTDWTSLYKNRFYYSRYDHSIGVALIVWHFTHDKVQTLAGLFHDISTPCFSHTADFRKGDALTQTATENETESFIRADNVLCGLLARDGISVESVCDYHLYPIADNERPQLSADRLEYMFPSGAALQGSWTLEEVAEVYGDLVILQDENGNPEIGFKSVKCAELYCEKFLETGHVLQLNENKLTLQLLARITERAVELGLITEDECYSCTEQQVMERFGECRDKEFRRLFMTYRNMTNVLHTDSAVEGCFCVNIKVKQRYIDPLVVVEREDESGQGFFGRACRLSAVTQKAANLIKDFLEYEDTIFGCVKLEN